MPSSQHSAIISQEQVVEALGGQVQSIHGLSTERTAGVLFLIQGRKDLRQEPVLLLNKRSPWVRQPGDLCCPGGRVHGGVDRLLGALLRFPGSPLVRSPGWKAGGKNGHLWKRYVSLYWACCLRESWEEMGLRPWGVTFLGLLPMYQLALFTRHILPMVGWISGLRHFRLNWEVERLVPLPFSSLLASENYGVYMLETEGERPHGWSQGPNRFPCYVHLDGEGREVLWGATYHIVESFLARVFGFTAPPIEGRPVVFGTLSDAYLTGERSRE